MRVFLAGCETFTDLMVECKVPYVLGSWWRLRNNKKKARAKLRQLKTAGCVVLLDSGAHSFYTTNWNLDPRQSQKSKVDVRFRKESTLTLEELQDEAEKYFRTYLKFLVDNQDCFDAAAEVDIDTLVGLDTVKKWRREMVEKGIKPIATYHNTEDYQKAGGTRPFVEECIELGLDYIGSPREGEPAFHDKFFTENLDLLKAHKIRVHLWGMTDQDAYRRIPGYSVDSTSWVNGIKYGTTHWWEPGHQKVTLHDYKVRDKIRKQAKVRQYCTDHGLDPDLFYRDPKKKDEPHVQTTNTFHMLIWRDFSIWMEQNPPNPYWLTQDEQTKNTLAKREELGITRLKKRDEYLPITAIDDDSRLELPRLCNTCVIKDRCPHYKEDTECAFPNLLQVDDPKDFRRLVMMLLSMEASRIVHAGYVERLTGGNMDPNVSKEFKIFAELMKAFGNLIEVSKPQQPRLTIQAEGGEAQGVLTRLFSKGGGSPSEIVDESQ